MPVTSPDQRWRPWGAFFEGLRRAIFPLLRGAKMSRLAIRLGLNFTVLTFALAIPAGAQTSGELRLEPGPDLSRFVARPIDAVRVETLGALWEEPIEVRSVRPGEEFSSALVRRAMRELDRTGRYADLRAEVREEGAKLVLVIQVRPRRLISQIRWEGGVLAQSDETRALALGAGDALTDLEIERARESLVTLYHRSGYPRARAVLTPEEVDNPREVLLRVSIIPGAALPIREVRFAVAPSPHHPALAGPLGRYDLAAGDRFDREKIEAANRELQKDLVGSHFYEARVDHEVQDGGVLEVRVQSGPRFTLRMEGNELFGQVELGAQLELTEDREPRPDLLEKVLEEFYISRGYLDAEVRVRRFDDEAGLRSELYFWIREGRRFRITERIYPCLGGGRSKKEIDQEIDGVLSEQFPSVPVFRAPSGDVIDEATGTRSTTPRPETYVGEPWSSFSKKSYEAVVEHLRDLYRSEGYLDAEVGPATIARRRCRADSPADRCLTDGPPPIPAISCEAPRAQEPSIIETCVPNRETGVRCEPEGTLVLPIFAGRQAILYDVSVEGNVSFSEEQLLELADLGIGKPLRRAEVDAALRRIQELYEEEAYAFAQIDSEIELSSDHTRARLAIGVTERQRVSVTRIDIRGATETREGLIRSRLSLKAGELYRRSLIQRSQEQLESLAVFTSVTIALEDPGVPAREKVVVVTVSERLPQYLDIKGGFGSEDGFRIGFEYGHRNLGGEAIQLTVRSQLALRPPFLIAEKDVRQKYQQLSDLQRLERRNTITLAFPEIGLGPLFRFEVELLDLLDNARDFSHTRDSAAVRLLFRPRRQYVFSVGGTIELNEATILGGESLLDYVQDNPGQNIRFPEGRSVAYTQNLGGSWDGRDQPLAATRGGYLGMTIEHVTAVPVGQETEGTCNEESSEVFDPVCSELLRISGRVAGYVPLSKKGLTLAVSFRAGVIQHLTDISKTYPDRLFFMGGVDTLRGYPQFSLVPQDQAERVLDPNDEFSIDEIVLRGGDIFVNPRVELRIPLGGSIQTALFLDAGNLWADRNEFNPFVLRYTAGTGLRIETPVGPLVFDYGFNIERLIDAFAGERDNSRHWEDIGAFHFSIGLF